MNRLLLGIVVALAFLFLAFVLVFGEAWILENWWEVTPKKGISQQNWLNDFWITSNIQACIAFVTALVWNFLGYWIYRIVDWKNSGGKTLWYALFFSLLIVLTAISLSTSVETQDNARFFVVISHVINGAFIYFGSSWLLSPSTIKYAPPLSTYSPLRNIL